MGPDAIPAISLTGIDRWFLLTAALPALAAPAVDPFLTAGPNPFDPRPVPACRFDAAVTVRLELDGRAADTNKSC